MKRSRVLEEIKDILICKLDCSRSFAEHVSEEILDKIENVGMLPPTRNADLKSAYGYARVQEWEKEDV